MYGHAAVFSCVGFSNPALHAVMDHAEQVFFSDVGDADCPGDYQVRFALFAIRVADFSDWQGVAPSTQRAEMVYSQSAFYLDTARLASATGLGVVLFALVCVF